MGGGVAQQKVVEASLIAEGQHDVIPHLIQAFGARSCSSGKDLLQQGSTCVQIRHSKRRRMPTSPVAAAAATALRHAVHTGRDAVDSAVAMLCAMQLPTKVLQEVLSSLSFAELAACLGAAALDDGDVAVWAIAAFEAVDRVRKHCPSRALAAGTRWRSRAQRMHVKSYRKRRAVHHLL